PGHATDRASYGRRAGTGRPDLTSARNAQKHRCPGAGRSPAQAETGLRSNRQNHCDEVLEALRTINGLPSVSALFLAPYSGFDHTIAKEIDRAADWINEFREGFHGGTLSADVRDIIAELDADGGGSGRCWPNLGGVLNQAI